MVMLKKATIHDVAQLSSVSFKTVSRVLNHEPNVHDATRNRVQDAMKTLKYSPNTSARRLAGKRSYLLALLYDNPSASYITSIQEGVLCACKEEHYEVLIYPCHRDDPALIAELSELIANVRVDGLLLTSPISDMEAVRQLLRKLQVPNVAIAPPNESDSKWTVGTNDREICNSMVRYLASLGHQRIAFVPGHPDHLAIANRFEGYKDGMKESGLEALSSLCVQGYNSFDSGLECGRYLLNREQPPTAIFCANDDMAAGVMRVARELEIAIPGSLSVAGFDDVPLASHTWPLLMFVLLRLKYA